MKILITTEWYKPVINGVVTSVLNLEKGLTADGHEVRILTLSPTHHSYKDGNVYYMASLGAGKIYPNARMTFPRENKYIGELIAWKPDVIHSQCEFSTFLFATKIAKVSGAPIVHTYHTVYEGYTHYFCPSKALGRKIVRGFTRKIADRTDAFIVPSTKMYRMLDGYHISSPMRVIPSGIELDQFLSDKEEKRKEIRESLGIDEQECILLFLGRIAKEKNIDEIFRFMADRRSENRRLLVVGDGPYREQLEEEAYRLGISDRLIFTGMVLPSEVKNYYAAGDVFISASTSETQGLTYMEAMASGLPVLCRKDDCLSDVVVQGFNGFLYTNEDEFFDFLNRISDSRNMRKEIGQNARKTMIQKFSVRTFSEACEKLYTDVKH